MRSETNDGYEQAEDDIECGAALTDPLATLHPKIIRLSAEDSVRFVEVLLQSSAHERCHAAGEGIL